MNWRTAELAAAYAAGSEQDPNYTPGPDETPATPHARADAIQRWNDAWGIGTTDNTRHRGEAA